MTETADNIVGPRSTNEIVGHQPAERTFMEAYQSERLHHAWLITGPKGVGKATLAWKFAKFLLTQREADDGGGMFDQGAREPGEAPALSYDVNSADVKRIEAGGHGGLLPVERTENEKTGKLRNDIVIGDIRRVNYFFSQTSAEGGWRVAIIDAADEMNRNAANALLKILEEPPEKSILFLIAHAPGKLLPTIKSRCRALKLNALPEAGVQAVLAARFPDLGTEELLALARLSDGAPGRAIELHLQGGIAIYRQMGALIADMPRLNIPEVHKLAVQLGPVKSDVQYHLFIQIFQSWLERLIRQNATNTPVADIMDGEGAQITRISALAGVDRWLDLWEKVGKLVARADAVNLDRKQVVVWLFTSLSTVARGQ